MRECERKGREREKETESERESERSVHSPRSTGLSSSHHFPQQQEGIVDEVKEYYGLSIVEPGGLDGIVSPYVGVCWKRCGGCGSGIPGGQSEGAHHLAW